MGLEEGNYYHIYNRGNAENDLFAEKEDYAQFLKRYDKYVQPVADTFAWVLMADQFHFLVRVRENMGYLHNNSDKPIGKAQFNEIKWETQDLSAFAATDNIKRPDVARHFGHFFSSYARYVNSKYSRQGGAFEQAFRHKQIDTEDQLRRLVLYCHHTPVHEGVCQHPSQYLWSSYQTCISEKPTKLQRQTVLQWFGGAERFAQTHTQYRFKEEP